MSDTWYIRATCVAMVVALAVFIALLLIERRSQP